MKLAQLLTAGVFLAVSTGYAAAQEELFVKARDASDVEVQIVDKNCWVDIFEDTEFDPDDPHLRLLGPLESATLKDMAGQDWSNKIQSIMIGPNATMYAYEDRDFSGTEVAFVANHRVS